MAEGGIRNTTSGDSVGFILTKDRVGYMFSSVIVQTLLVHAMFVFLATMCNIIYKETWLNGSAHVFCIYLVIFEE